MKRVYIYIIIGVGIGVIAIALLNRKIILKAVWDFNSEQNIKTLHPDIQKDVRRFINKAERQGIALIVTDGFRTFKEQDRLYAQGRTTSGKIVTNAKGGQSFHNYGLSFDVTEIKDGELLWEKSQWEKISELGEGFGFEWGGRWRKPDLPHFQKTFGYSTSNFLAMYQETGEKYPQIA